jgi:tRNA(Ile)-lysidine synthase
MARKTAPAADAAALDPDRLFARLSTARGLVLAVSGGPDSTALMALVARWRGRPPALVVTVDHGLRPEAADEARLVAANAERLGLPRRIMHAPARPASGNLQDWARRARYACLAAAAREAGFDAIVTAHHREDQAETFLLRLARGSGVYGLAAMSAESAVEGVRLVRPLLGVARSALMREAETAGLATVSDPSNAHLRFDRVHMRVLMPVLAEHGLDSARLADTAGRLARAAAALDQYAGTLLKDGFAADRFGSVAGSARALTQAPEEVGLRALALILRAVGGADYTPPLDGVEALWSAIVAAGEAGRVKRTLHGVELAVAAGRLTARREWGRSGPAGIPARAGETALWDRRFRVAVPAGIGDVTIGPLSAAGVKAAAAGADRAALRTLPALYLDSALAALPDLIGTADAELPAARFAARAVVGERLGLAPAATLSLSDQETAPGLHERSAAFILAATKREPI